MTSIIRWLASLSLRYSIWIARVQGYDEYETFKKQWPATLNQLRAEGYIVTTREHGSLKSAMNTFVSGTETPISIVISTAKENQHGKKV